MADLDSLVVRTVAGDTEAWQQLQAAIEPTIVSIARGHQELRTKGLAQSVDAQREIAVATLERFAHDDFASLRTFLLGPKDESKPRNFDAWLYRTVHFAALDYLRGVFGRAPELAEEPSRPLASKRDVNSWAGRLDATNGPKLWHQTIGITKRIAADQIVAYIHENFSADEVHAMQLHYFEGSTLDELTERLGLADKKSAERLIRKLNQRLRDYFETSSGE